VELIMRVLFAYFRRHWPALLAVTYMAGRMSRSEDRESVIAWICVGAGVLGMALNLLVILVNGGMPAAVAEDEIPEISKPHYRPVSENTKFAVLSDWIPLGNLLISPGDVLLLLAVTVILLRSAAGW
jgi:Family of unknown function (DUF5317)